MDSLKTDALASQIADAYARRIAIPAPSSSHPGFDLSDAYATEAALVRMRRDAGHRTSGLKVGFANKAVWRVLKLDTLVWAHMYDDTVHYAKDGAAALSTASMFSPKIEPEIVFKLSKPIEPRVGAPLRGAGGSASVHAREQTVTLSAADVLESVESIAIGFEIIDCVFPDWKFQPADFVAAYGLHAALIVGEPATVDPGHIVDLVDKLPKFTVRLFRNGELIAEGTGRNSLRSPALCLAELGAGIARRPDAQPLGPGDLVSSGTLTESQPIAAGEVWRVEVEGIGLESLTLTLG